MLSGETFLPEKNHSAHKELAVGKLRLLQAPQASEIHNGDIFGCAFAPDGQSLLTAGWDGHLRLWDVASGESTGFVQVATKPLSCCGYSPDGTQLVAGSMEGVLSFWSASQLTKARQFMAHTRPISAICYAPNGQQFATASWDRLLILHYEDADRETKHCSGHEDIVAGCRFTSDGRQLLSWSHDRTLRLWETTFGTELCKLTGHQDRVTAAAIAPDGRFAVSGGRDCLIKLWNLQEGVEAGSWPQTAEIRGVFFLLDGNSFVAVDAEGRVFQLSLPSMELCGDLKTRVKPICAELAPSGTLLALGCEDGTVRFVALEDASPGSLVVTATQSLREESSLFGRFFGKTRTVSRFRFTCPVCRHTAESSALPPADFPCGYCRRPLRVGAQILQTV
jgi:WD40 repeat protein